MLHVLTPSRGRMENAARLQRALRETCTGDFVLWLGVDTDDPTLDDYRQLEDVDTNVVVQPRDHLCGWTNKLAWIARTEARAEWLASLGDDHVPRTKGWDTALIDAIRAMDGPGWAYGNDLLRRADTPTAWVQSAALVKALGWMMLPGCEHLYVDTAVKDLGTAAGRIAYLGGPTDEDGVVIEHMHSANGKAPDDQLYRDANSGRRIRRDGSAWRVWLDGPRFTQDVSIVRALTWGATDG